MTSASVNVADAVTDYADDVLTGKIITGEWAKKACQRHMNDLDAAPDSGFFFDIEEAQYVFDFFACLRFWEGKWAGQPFELQPWQKFKIGSLFGWRRVEDGLRRFRTAYWEFARKNGKSTDLAGIGLYMLEADGEPGAQVYSAATKKDQAKIIFNCAKNLSGSSPFLTEKINVYLNNLSILQTYSKFEPLASDSKKADGFSVSCGLVDELHEHPNGGMMDVLETGTGSREQPLIIYITTAGQDKFSVCYEQHEYSEAILKGQIKDDTYFPLIYTLDKGCKKGCKRKHKHKAADDWRDEKVWIKANPNLGVSVLVDDLIRKKDKARHILRQQTTFRRKHCNEWVGSEDRWLDVELWDACGKPFNPDLLKGKVCFGALDLSSKLDITAFVLVFPPEDENGVYKIMPYFWVPGENIEEKARKDRCPYDVWRDQGFIEATKGNVVDYRHIQNKILKLSEKYIIQEIGFDPWNATETALKLQSEGFEMVEIRQGAKTLSEPMKAIEAFVVNKQLAHNGNPVLSWMVDNLIVRTDPNDNIAPDKKMSRQRIDGMVATIMAFCRILSQETEDSIYNTSRGIVDLIPKDK